MNTNTTSALWRRITVAALAARALSGGTLFAMAPANAKPIDESTIKSERLDAGGKYSTIKPTKKGGGRISHCTFSDNTYDEFLNGTPNNAGEQAGTGMHPGKPSVPAPR